MDGFASTVVMFEYAQFMNADCSQSQTNIQKAVRIFHLLV